MTSAFIGGSIASAMSGWLHDAYGWTGVTAFGAVLPLLAGCIWLYDARLERRRQGVPSPDGA
jgi:cyanate permease